MNALALDLGSSTGYSLGSKGEVTSGTWTFCSDAELRRQKADNWHRRGDKRISRFWDCLHTTHTLTPLDWIFFEDVQFAKTTAQAHLWASFRGVVWVFAHVNHIRVECCPVGTLKKFGAGIGTAEKAGMAYALAKQNPGRYVLLSQSQIIYDRVQKTEHDDNAVDAIHLLNWGLNLTRNAAS